MAFTEEVMVMSSLEFELQSEHVWRAVVFSEKMSEQLGRPLKGKKPPPLSIQQITV